MLTETRRSDVSEGLAVPVPRKSRTNRAGRAAGPPPNRLRLSQRALIAARSAARVIARKLNADVGYDLRLYEAIRDLRSWTSQDIIFDVGANDGRTIFRLMRHLPSPRIIAFEPVGDTFRVLTERTEALQNVERHQLGMGAEEAQLPMYLNASAALNSLYPDWDEPRGTVLVDITTVDRFALQAGVERIHLLKVDAEGHDLEVLKGAEESLREGRVDIVMVESGFSAPGSRRPSLQEFQAYLRPFGYYLHGIYNQCRSPVPLQNAAAPEPGRTPPVLIFCDALFVRARVT